MSIQEHLNKIRNAIYGREVRESIAKGIETAYDDASENGNANMEVKIARGTHPNLRSRLEEVDDKQQQTTSQLAQKITKNRGAVDTPDLSQNVKEIINGDRPLPIAEVDSILTENIVDGQVTTRKTDFIESNNLWDGKYYDGIYINNSDEVHHRDNSDYFSDYLGAIERIEGGQIYSVTKKAGGNRFAIAACDILPELDEVIAPLKVLRGNDDSTEQTFSIEVPEDANYIVVFTGTIAQELPEIVINKGAKSREERLSFEKNIKGLASLKRSEKNLFDGEYVKANLSKDVSAPIYSLRKNFDSFDGRLEVQSGVGGQTFTVSFPDRDNNRLRIGTSATPVSIESITSDRTYTEFNQLDEIIYDSNDEGVLHELTFTVGEGQDYLYIYVSSEGKEPRMQLERGSAATKYEPPYMLARAIAGDSKKIVSSPRYFFADDLVGTYNTDTVQNFENPTNVQTSEVISDYDEIQSDFPEYISEKESIGTSQGGEEIYYYKFMPHVLDSDRPIGIPKIIIISGTHGDEKNAVFSTLNFIRKMCYDWKDDKVLEFFRFNVEFIIVPVFNVDGFNRHLRRTLSDVDLNRDFPSGWQDIWSNGDHPASQKETQLMMAFLESHRDAEFIIDNHRVNWGDNGYVTYAICEDPVINEVANKTQNLLGRKWAKDYDFFPQDENHKHGYTTEHLPGSMVKYIDDEEISRAVLLETTWEVQWNPSWERYDDLSVLIGTEWLGNMLKGLMKTLQ